ncbi:MAG: CRISPR-associated endonuclease Cas2 [Terrimicrobiaceae bacterium]
MQVLVTYDVATSSEGGSRRLRRVAKVCLDYGQRVQNSVFECKIDQAQFVALRKRILDLVDCGQDSVRFYFLGNDWNGRVEHYGAKPSLNMDGPLLL